MEDQYTLIEQSRTILINYDITSRDDSSRDMDCLKFNKWQKTHAYCAWKSWQLQGSNGICNH